LIIHEKWDPGLPGALKAYEKPYVLKHLHTPGRAGARTQKVIKSMIFSGIWWILVEFGDFW
jgi:hypothetical protein